MGQNERSIKTRVLRHMAFTRRRLLPVFSFMRFISWLVPWSWIRDPRGYSQGPKETSTHLESAALDEQTDGYLSVSNDDLEYLTRGEAEQIIERFKEIPQSYDRLLFWTGIPREWVQQWADDHGMLTFTSAMGYLMDRTDPRCLKRVKKLKQWSKYVRGASGIFARFACGRGIIRVLTLPPSWAGFIRPQSTYRTIEEPVLKGTSGCCCAVQINTVHLLTTLEQLEYQTWPENHIPEGLRSPGTGSFDFRIPRWIRKAVKAATESLRSNVVRFTAFPTPKPANANIVSGGSVRKTSETQSAKQPKDGKQSVSKPNAQGSLQLQSQRPQSKIQQPQNQQSSSKTQGPRSQQPKSKKQSQVQRHSHSQQPQSTKQPPQSKKQQPQNQQPQTQRPQTQRPQSTKQLPPAKKQKPQNQQPQSKKQQSQNQQQSSTTTQQSRSRQLQSKKQQSQSQLPQPQSRK